MNDVWFGPGLTRDDLHAFLEALALDRRNDAPLIAVAIGEGEQARLVMASRSLFRMFGVDSSEALSRRLLAGRDPGARRLADLFRSLPLGGAPRLERLRFLIGPGSEALTFLCRRMRMETGVPVFLAAALGVRPGLMTPASIAPTQALPPGMGAPGMGAPGTSAPGTSAPGTSAPGTSSRSSAAAAEPAHAEAPPVAPQPEPAFAAPMSVPAIHAALAARWPASRRVRFLWRSDADGVLSEISAPLAEAVGAPNGDLVGRSLAELAPRLDPSGRFAGALAGRATWSGLDVDWPITDAPGAVAIGLGAVPAFTADRVFDGYRGYGVIHLDKVTPVEPTRLLPPPTREGGNVVPFPNGGQRNFSAEDQIAFDALGAALRNHVGYEEAEDEPAMPEPLAAPAVAPERAHEDALSSEPALRLEPVPATSTPSEPAMLADAAPKAARANGLAVLDRLALGLLVSRGDVPIFANRHLLDQLGFADEDALHEAGGLAHLFGGEACDPGGEAVLLRGNDGRKLATQARVQRIDWDGLPATLLTLQPAPEPGAVVSLEAERDAAIEAMARDHAEARRRDDGELKHLRAILETATDGVAVVDAKGDVLSLNRSGEALLGRDRGGVVGKPFLDLFAPDTRGLARDYLEGLTTNATRSLLNGGREIEVKTAQGATIPVFMTLGRLDVAPASLADPGAGEARFCALFRDLTHWKKVEHELQSARGEAERTSAAKTDFLAKISHEIRTPLNAIIGFAEVILEERFGAVGNARYRDYLRDIHTSGTHVMSLVNDLLDLSKIEAGRMELSPTAIDANKIITECVGLMQPQASRERVIMRLSLSPILPMIRADERSLRQIVLNILSNAVKFNEPGGQVIVATAAPEDGKVVIRVRDTGPGMSEADIVAALEPFRQVSTRPTEGTGLGLPLTKALVEANEATFQIRSKVDHGTLIEVAFPPARVLAGQR